MKTLLVVSVVVIASGLAGLYLNTELRRERVAEMEQYVELQEKHAELQESHVSLLAGYKASETERERLRRVVEANCFFKEEQAVSLGEAYSETVPYETPIDIQQPLPYVE